MDVFQRPAHWFSDGFLDLNFSDFFFDLKLLELACW